jgi:predicted transcriptional regulator
MTDIGQQLRAARESKGMSIGQLSAYSQIPKTSISDFERGAGDLPVRRAIQAFKTLGIRLEFQAEPPSESD